MNPVGLLGVDDGVFGPTTVADGGAPAWTTDNSGSTSAVTAADGSAPA